MGLHGIRDGPRHGAGVEQDINTGLDQPQHLPPRGVADAVRTQPVGEAIEYAQCQASHWVWKLR